MTDFGQAVSGSGGLGQLVAWLEREHGFRNAGVALTNRRLRDEILREGNGTLFMPSDEAQEFVGDYLLEATENMSIHSSGNGSSPAPSHMSGCDTALIPIVLNTTAACTENADCAFSTWRRNELAASPCSDLYVSRECCCIKKGRCLPGNALSCADCPLFPFAFVLIASRDQIGSEEKVVLELARERCIRIVERILSLQEIRKQHEVSAALHKLLIGTNEKLDLEARLKLFLGMLAGAIAADVGYAFVFESWGEGHKLGTCVLSPGSTSSAPPPDVMDIARSVARTGKPLLLETAASGSSPGAACSSMTLALSGKGPLTTVVHLGTSDDSRRFCKGDFLVMQEFMRNASVFVENALLYSRMDEKEKLDRMLLTKMINAQEDERKRIASDIHDDTIQALISSFYRLEGVEMLIDQSRLEEAIDELQETKSSLQRNITGMRRLLFDLRPSILDDAGLAPAIENYLNRLEDDCDIRNFFYVEEGFGRLSPAVEVTAYRLAQEVLTNVRKHSQATELVVKLMRKGNVLEVSIKDNGVGFDIDEVLSEAGYELHFGLKSVVERAQLSGGEAMVIARPGEGTEVLIQIPEEI